MTNSVKLFGTDGIRGIANQYPMDSETVLALARTLAQKQLLKRPARVIIAKDTRASGYMLETALASGFIAEGVDIIYTGPVPTPAVPFLIQQDQADLGIMLTASHNPWQDNGIKIFTSDGGKLSDAEQNLINDHIGTISASFPKKLGQALHSSDARMRYQEQVRQSVPEGFHLKGLKVVLDCAHGATYRVAREIFAPLEAKELIILHDAPDGYNINLNCGATSLGALQAVVVDHQADIGLAFDGDGDRLIAVDELGRAIDGDQIMSALAHHWAVTEGFAGDIVCTVMSNKGMDRFFDGIGVTVHRTPVGDRHVIAKMRELNARFGGEQSGHMIFRDHGFSGDGLLSALQLLNVMQTQEVSASRLGQTFAAMPQKMINVPMPARPVDVRTVTAQAEKIVGTVGQVLVRPSGTEPILRIMAQAETLQQVETAIQTVAESL